MKPHQLHQLPPSDRASLAAALTKFIADQASANPLYQELLADTNKSLRA